MTYNRSPGALRSARSVDLRTGTPYANLIAAQIRFAAALGDSLSIDPRDIIPTSGATGAIEAVRNHVFRSSRNRPPTVLTVCPGYWRARESFAGFGFEVKNVETKGLGFSIDEDGFVDRALFDEPDLIYLSLPNNPTGAVFSPESIVDRVSDETTILLDLTLPSRGLDTKRLTTRLYEKSKGRRVFLAGSTSKSHGTAECRVGWLICANAKEAAALKEENRNVVALNAIEAGLGQLGTDPIVFREIDESFALLSRGEQEGLLEIVRPERRVETGYVLIRPQLDPEELRRSLDEAGIRVMWGSEFGLDDGYVRIETLEPPNIGVFTALLGAKR